MQRENITVLREIGNGHFSNVMEASVVGLAGVLLCYAMTPSSDERFRELLALIDIHGLLCLYRVVCFTSDVMCVGSSNQPISVAAKFSASTGTAAEGDIAMMHTEACQMVQFNHTNVVKLLGVCFDSMPCCILLELMPNGDARTYLRASADKAGE